MNTPSRPLVRYHGGKWLLADWIISHFPAHKCYVEPYGGGGSVLIRKPRAHAEIYNDLDHEIVNLFKVVRDHGQQLLEKLELTPFAREEFELSYLDGPDAVEQARRTVLRSFAGFGSNVFKMTRGGRRERTGFRASSTRSGTPSAEDWRNYPDALPAIIDRLRGVVIEQRDAMLVMAKHDGPGTLHYADPPYVEETRGPGHDYRHEMTDKEHEALAAFLQEDLEGFRIVSGYPSPLYDRLYEGWERVTVRALADGDRERVECLWLCPRVSAALHPGPLFAPSAVVEI